jgi:type II secretory pathway pseudopilin PulG
MLVVIAITSILLTLVFKPLVDSFNLTTRAEIQIQGLQSARIVQNELGTLLGNAVYIFDNKSTTAPNDMRVNLWFKNASGANIIAVPLQFAMLEAVMPARIGDQSPNSTIIDPTTGLPMYTSGSGSTSEYAFPSVPGRSLTRVFIGLQRNATKQDPQGGNGIPVVSYGNRYTDPVLNGGSDNRTTLYRAEFTTSIPDPDAPKSFIPNLKLFHTSANAGGVANTRTGALILHDPNFFYDNSLAGDATDSPGSAKWAVPGWRDLNSDGKVEISENWAAIAASMLPLNRVDAISLARNDDNTIQYDSNGAPIIRPLVLFSPGSVNNDPGVPSALDNAGNESPNPAPPMYTTQFTHFNSPYQVSVYRSASGDPLTQNPLSYFTTNGNGQVFQWQVTPGGQPQQQFGGLDVGPHLIANGVFDPTAVQANQIYYAFTVDPERGLINFVFPAAVMVHGPQTTVNGQPFYQPLPSAYFPEDVNAGLAGPYEKRYLDLKVLPLSNAVGTGLTAAGSYALNPGSAQSPLAPGTNWFSYVHIVPGSERVYGPDQNPGPHYGKSILYTRVPSLSAQVGPNQYKINYDAVMNVVNNSDPRTSIGYIEFDSSPDTSDPNAPNEAPYNPSAPVSGMENPPIGVFRPHSLPSAKVDGTPADPIQIYYNFQMNRSNDVIKADYQTREMINVSLQTQLFDPTTAAPQNASLTQQIRIRNLQH